MDMISSRSAMACEASPVNVLRVASCRNSKTDQRANGRRRGLNAVGVILRSAFRERQQTGRRLHHVETETLQHRQKT